MASSPLYIQSDDAVPRVAVLPLETLFLNLNLLNPIHPSLFLSGPKVSFSLFPFPFPYPSCLFAKVLPPIKVQISTRQKQYHKVTRNKRCKDPQIPPPIHKRKSQRLKELIAHLVRAVIALFRARRRTGQVSRPAGIKERSHVVRAAHVWRTGKVLKFLGCADDRQVMEFRYCHAAYQTCKGVELVQPDAPELGDLRLGNGDAAEEGKCDDDKGVDEDGDEAAGCEGGDPGLGLAGYATITLFPILRTYICPSVTLKSSVINTMRNWYPARLDSRWNPGR